MMNNVLVFLVSLGLASIIYFSGFWNGFYTFKRRALDQINDIEAMKLRLENDIKSVNEEISDLKALRRIMDRERNAKNDNSQGIL